MLKSTCSNSVSLRFAKTSLRESNAMSRHPRVFSAISASRRVLGLGVPTKHRRDLPAKPHGLLGYIARTKEMRNAREISVQISDRRKPLGDPVIVRKQIPYEAWIHLARGRTGW